MPISYPGALSHVGFRIIQLKPRSILDVGCGFGLWGFLSRMYTDLDERRLQREHWKVIIDAIEIFSTYIGPIQRELYTHVFVGDAMKVLPQLGSYDLAICGDMIEHLTRADGLQLIQLMKQRCKRFFVITPARWIEQGTVFGNPHERHIYRWTREDLAPFGTVLELNRTLILEAEGVLPICDTGHPFGDGPR